MPPADAATAGDLDAFREEVRRFLARELPPDWAGIGRLDHHAAQKFVAEWRDVLGRNGLLGLSWPEEFGGRGMSKLAEVVLAEECAEVGVPTSGLSDPMSIKMVGNTLLRWGTDEQKRRLLPGILSGTDVWCQGFSEPEAGSDLAGVRTSAVRDGDTWVVHGAKLWTARAREANWIFLLVRTDPAVAGHKGLTFLLVPLDQPGIDIRPVRMLSGRDDFCEVFLDGARTDATNVVGAVDDGWSVVRTLLGLERGEEAATNPIMFRHEFDRLVELARERGADRDPVMRDRIAQCFVKVEVMRYLGHRILTTFMAGDRSGPEASITKLYWSEYHQEVTQLALDILGMESTVPSGRPPTKYYRADDAGAPNSSASWVGAFYNSLAGTIYAGTNEIQRNIIAEGALGLPREARS